MRHILIIFGVLLVVTQGIGQDVQAQNKKQIEFNEKINDLLSFTVPFITVDELDKNFDDYQILDSREQEEFDVAHIKGASCIGYDDFDIKTLADIDKDQKIAVYCSIGYRSEKITEKLRKAGYKNAYNVYGSIFQWVNDDKPIYNPHGKEVKDIHTYNWLWSRWVLNKKINKVW